MKKLVHFAARHLAVSIFTIALSLVAVIGSAYGFTEVVAVASFDSSITQVKTEDEFNQEETQKDPTPTPTKRINSSTSLSVVPTQILIKNGVKSQIDSSSSQNSSSKDSMISHSPSFERDDDIEDMHEEDEKEYIENESEEEKR